MRNELIKYLCKHGVLGFCEYCWAEDFRFRRLNDPNYHKQVEELRIKERIK